MAEKQSGTTTTASPVGGDAGGGGWSPKQFARAAGILLVSAGAIFGVGYLVGSNAADDADQVAELEAELDTTESKRSALSSDVDDLEEDRASLEDEVTDLEEQLDAERNLKPGSTRAQRQASSAAPVPTDVSLGQAADVGSVTLKLTSLTQTNTGSTASTWRAAITAKNNGSESITLFCGGGGAQMIDTQGRRFDGDSVLSGSTDNCGDDLQPGLTGSFAMDFKTPADAKPAAVRLWDDSDFDDSDAKVWSVK